MGERKERITGWGGGGVWVKEKKGSQAEVEVEMWVKEKKGSQAEVEVEMWVKEKKGSQAEVEVECG